MLFRNLAVALFTLTILGCVIHPETKLDPVAKADGRRHVQIQLESDPDLVAFELRSQLETAGFEVDDGTVQSKADITTVNESKDEMRTYRNVIQSHAPYVLAVAYSKGGFPYKAIWRARFVDRAAGRTLGTYSYDWDEGVGINHALKDNEVVADMIRTLVEASFKR